MISLKFICVVFLIVVLIQAEEISRFSTDDDYQPGKREDFEIIEGNQILPSDAPWTVAIKLVVSGTLQCSATIIHPKHVLTTASCVSDADNEKYFVYAGTCLPNDNQSYNVTKIFRHENYGLMEPNYESVNDIAVVRVDRIFDFDKCLSLIDMADKNEEIVGSLLANMYFWQDQVNSEGRYVRSMLYSLPLSINTYDECNGHFRKSDVPILYKTKICGVSDMTLCMLDLWGSSLVSGNVTTKRLIGFYDSNEACKDSKYGHVFTRVAPYRAWIDDQINQV
ncbi:hypothetical protein QAD02_011254 [Eretmocerus hayati]|uniref:Uncharacterized protein n=1 Tax=Eretmocerus hayati TaxID=131215 RepID=A0ACC2NX77_9HYME|nr:hypothetical protein QAD02_011254 [Eretmocerus hayati]